MLDWARRAWCRETSISFSPGNGINLLPQQVDGASKNIFMRIYPRVVTPERFYRGSTVQLTTTLSHVEWVEGSGHNFVWIPTVREPHRPEGNRGIEAFGNDR